MDENKLIKSPLYATVVCMEEFYIDKVAYNVPYKFYSTGWVFAYKAISEKDYIPCQELNICNLIWAKFDKRIKIPFSQLFKTDWVTKAKQMATTLNIELYDGFRNRDGTPFEISNES